MSSAKWITCERHGRWAAACGAMPAATGVRTHETRSLDECWEMLAGSPASLIVVEPPRANRDGLLHRLAGLERDYPLARVAVVAERSLASWEGLIREAGAAWFFTVAPRPAIAGVNRSPSHRCRSRTPANFHGTSLGGLALGKREIRIERRGGRIKKWGTLISANVR